MVNQEIKAFAQKIVELLPATPGEGLFNPYTQTCVAFDSAQNAPEKRFERLVSHLDCNAKLILIGEAPGYNGCRYSGIAFTCEHQLLEGVIPRVTVTERITKDGVIRKEASADTVWPTLHRLGVADVTVMWNSVQLHPYRLGNTQSNRSPRSAERMMGLEALKLLISGYPDAVLVAVGRNAEVSLKQMGIQNVKYVRHPSFGGNSEFVSGLTAIVGAMACD